MMRKAFLMIVGLAIASPTATQAACNVIVNNRPMTVEECRIALQVYGRVEPGYYYADNYGNWVKSDGSARGNYYVDAQRGQGSGGSGGGSGHWSDGPGLQRTPFGSVGGGMYKSN